MSLAATAVSLPDVPVSRIDIASARGRLQAYHARYTPFFGRHERRGHAHTYLQGLLSNEPCKSIECMVLWRPAGTEVWFVLHRRPGVDHAQVFLCHTPPGEASLMIF